MRPPDGNTRTMDSEDIETNYDFHFSDVTEFYTHGAVVYAPADGEIVKVVDHLEDLYDVPFDIGEAIKRIKVGGPAGSYIVIKHNDNEFSHLFCIMKGSSEVDIGGKVEC